MAKHKAWMAFAGADYLKATNRLTTEQHGAYFLLILDVWENGPIPDDDQILATTTRLPLDRWLEHRPRIAPYFAIEGGTWRHERIEKELSIAEDRYQAKVHQTAAARAAAEEKRRAALDSPVTPPVTESVTGSVTSHTVTDTVKQTPLPLAGGSSPPAPAKRAKGDPTPTTQVWKAYADEFAKRYGMAPPRNSKINGQLSNLLQRVGIEEAPLVAGYYVRQDFGLYQARLHPIDLLLRDCERLVVERRMGRKVGEAPPTARGDPDAWRARGSTILAKAKELGLEIPADTPMPMIRSMCDEALAKKLPR